MGDAPVLVAGLGVSGVAAARVLLGLGSRVLLTDAAERPVVAELTAAGATWLGELSDVPEGTGLVVTSPGWRPDSPLLADAARRGIEVVGEPELAWRLRIAGPDGVPAPWLAVTGTNGKTTTVTMLEAILQADGRRAVAAGNVGRPLVEVVTARDPDGTPTFDTVAVELSSFQLHWSSTLAPAAAAVLNVADDHTDWHGSFAAYRDAKARILERAPVAVADAGDPVASSLVAAHPHPVTVTLGEPGPGQLGVRVRRPGRPGASPPTRPGRSCSRPACCRCPARTTPSTRWPPPPWRGPPASRRSPSAAAWPASAAARTATCWSPPSTAWTGSTTARPPTRTRPGRRWPPTRAWCGSPVACSRAPTSTRWSRRWRRGWPGWCCWAAIGSRSPRQWRDTPRRSPSWTVPSGDDDGMDGTGVTAEATTARVVAAARGLARPGDTVLLAPAAASMDVYRDYAHRGTAFAAAVRALG